MMIKRWIVSQLLNCAMKVIHGIYKNVRGNGVTLLRVKDFTRMNPMEFHESKVDKDLQEFIEEIHIVDIIGVTSVERVDFTAYQLETVS